MSNLTGLILFLAIIAIIFGAAYLLSKILEVYDA
jgi:flagellar biogenesis protein FliO